MASSTELAAPLGLHRSGREWRGDCPLCGYRDALVLGVGRGGAPLLWCASCDDRDGLRALLRDHGAIPVAAAPRQTWPSRKKQTDGKELALGLWRGSRPAVGTIAERYLTTRGLPGLATSSSLRFRADCPHPGGGRLAAMVALVTDAGGEPIGIARTFLRRDGSAKADVEPPRATLGSIRGGAVRLDPAATELVVGEGIESSASAGRLLGLPAWSAIAAGNLERGLVLPGEIRSVIIAVDRDPAGERAARAAWQRWRAEGRTVRLLWPQTAGADCADVLTAREPVL